MNVSLDQTSYFTDAEFSLINFGGFPHFSQHHNTKSAFTGAGSGAVSGTVTAGSFEVLKHSKNMLFCYISTRDGWDLGCTQTDGRNVRQQGQEIQQRPSTRLKNEEMKRPQSWTAKDLESFHGEKRLTVFLGGMYTKRIIETRVPNAG